MHVLVPYVARCVLSSTIVRKVNSIPEFGRGLGSVSAWLFDVYSYMYYYLSVRTLTKSQASFTPWLSFTMNCAQPIRSQLSRPSSLVSKGKPGYREIHNNLKVQPEYTNSTQLALILGLNGQNRSECLQEVST